MRPLYLQVRDLVLERITGGTWKPGAMLPAEVDLARELGISSGTVRKALDALEAEHVVSRRQGKGTFVNDSKALALAWRYENVLGLGVDLFHDPPFRWAFATDLNLPHWWDIGAALAAPVQRNQDDSLLQFLLGASFYTWREAALGFIVGTLLGLLLATLFVHFGLLERAFVPYVVASQTIPIVALAPMIVFAFGPSVTSVVVIATYLTFFPVTIAMIRGLRSPDPRALELMRSYAASKWQIYRQVRFPASMVRMSAMGSTPAMARTSAALSSRA